MTMDAGVPLLFGLLALTLWLAWRQSRMESQVRRMAESPPASLQLLQREVQAVRAGIDERLREHLQQAQELSLRVGRLQKATEHVEQLGVGLEELQRILQPPQLRGVFGERLLEDLLREMLPVDRFRLQHTYPISGVRVDAAILFNDGRLLPVDSKFPLDNFRRCVELRGSGNSEAARAFRAFARDVRGHVDAIAERYLSPDDGALEVAFMYIPSESIYHEVCLSRLEGDGTSLAEYALRRRVVPVSPNTLHAYLSVVRMGLRGFRLQESARDVLRHLVELGGDVEALRTQFNITLKQARHSLANLRDVDDHLRRIETRLGSLGAACGASGTSSEDASSASSRM